jgi:2'-5' RNA ligase
MMRAFIAIDLPNDVRTAIEEAQALLKRAPVGVKISWTKVANLHLTLQFLGDIGEAVVDKITPALRSVAAQRQPFDVTVRGAGAFPDEKRPRVVWIGCDDDGKKLQALARAVHDTMQPFGFAPDHHEFSAHLTLGRIRSPRPDAALTRAMDSLKDKAFGTLWVEAIHLFESQLHPEGSIYRKLSSHALGAHN